MWISLETPLDSRSAVLIEFLQYVSATIFTMLYPTGKLLKMFNVSSSYVLGISVSCLIHGIRSTIKAETLFFAGTFVLR